MNRRIFIPTLLIGTLLAGSAGLTFAEPGPGRDGYGRGGNCARSVDERGEHFKKRLQMMAVALGLSQEQQDQIKQLLSKHFEQSQGLREQLRQNRDTLRQQMRSSNFDEQSFRTQAEKQADLKTDMMVAQAKLKQQIDAILTPEQQKKAETLRQLRGEGRHGRHGMDW